MKDLIITKLQNNIKNTNRNKSSYWKQHLPENADILNENNFFMFGTYTKKSLKNNFLDILARIIFKKNIFKTKLYKKIKTVFDYNNRKIDIDTIRHIFTFEKIKLYYNPQKICLIGDGKLNGVLSAYLQFPNAKIYSVNLSEVLINDYIILTKTNIDLKNSVDIIDNINFKGKNKLTLVPSNFKEFLFNQDIDLFINIASFQEMTTDEIDNYFKIIKKNRAKLYCCNRQYKKLYGGEEIYFERYPFSNSKKLFWGDCPWYQKWYSIRPPFIHNYDGNVMHCLVDFN